MNLNSFSRIELHFWNFAIRALSTSDVARRLVKDAYDFTHQVKSMPLSIVIGISGVAGLVSGYLFYFLQMSLR